MGLFIFRSSFLENLIISIPYHNGMKYIELFKMLKEKYLLWLVACGALVVGIGSGAGVTASVGRKVICETNAGDTDTAMGGEYIGSGMDEGPDGIPSGEGNCPGGMWVDIAGSVNDPGLYCAGSGWVLGTLLDEAGGMTENACAVFVERDMNRAQRLEPNMKIYIPGSTDIECLSGGQEVLGTGGGVVAPGTAGPSPIGPAGTGCTDGKVNLNTASSSELESLSGIGPATAGKIIEGRPYTSADDLLNVSGIGPATLGKIEDSVCW
jgi:competence protein ComEA